MYVCMENNIVGFDTTWDLRHPLMGLGTQLLWIRVYNAMEHWHHPWKFICVWIWLISPDSYLVSLPWARWITHHFTVSVPLHSFRTDMSEVAPCAADMHFEWEEVCLLFLYEFSCHFACLSSHSYWQYILWFSTTESQLPKRPLRVMKGSI